MNDYKCVNAQIIKQGLFQKITCSAMEDGLCACIRYCPTKKSIEHSDMAQYCLKNPNRKEYQK
jgi:hypothetical protein